MIGWMCVPIGSESMKMSSTSNKGSTRLKISRINLQLRIDYNMEYLRTPEFNHDVRCGLLTVAHVRGRSFPEFLVWSNSDGLCWYHLPNFTANLPLKCG